MKKRILMILAAFLLPLCLGLVAAAPHASASSSCAESIDFTHGSTWTKVHVLSNPCSRPTQAIATGLDASGYNFYTGPTTYTGWSTAYDLTGGYIVDGGFRWWSSINNAWQNVWYF